MHHLLPCFTGVATGVEKGEVTWLKLQSESAALQGLLEFLLLC